MSLSLKVEWSVQIKHLEDKPSIKVKVLNTHDWGGGGAADGWQAIVKFGLFFIATNTLTKVTRTKLRLEQP